MADSIGSGSEKDQELEDRRRLRRVLWLLWIWIVAYMVVTVLFKIQVIPWGAPSIAVALLPSALGVWAVATYLRFLRRAAERLRRIHLEAVALAGCAGVVAMLGYRLMERAGAPRMDLSDPFLVMLVFWGVGLRLGARS